MPVTRPSARGAVITGWGTALPPKVLTNQDLADMGLDTSDQWIVERTGIRERRVGGTTTGLAVEAAERAMAKAGLGGDDLDLVLLCTCTPDEAMPASASAVQQALGITGGAVDLNAACSGFVYGLVAADGFLRGAELTDRILHAALGRALGGEDRGAPVGGDAVARGIVAVARRLGAGVDLL